MSNELTTTADAAIAERVMIIGDLAQLTPQERVSYYSAVCRSIGLNPLTRPFDYITLNGKLMLYAKKDATDQLRKINDVSIGKPDIQFQDDLIIVTVAARDRGGREDSDIGVVRKNDMRGDLSNALMKAVTKAKRRVTLSICGLGFLDETEVESVPDAKPTTINADGVIISKSCANGHTEPPTAIERKPVSAVNRQAVSGLVDQLARYQELNETELRAKADAVKQLVTATNDQLSARGLDAINPPGLLSDGASALEPEPSTKVKLPDVPQPNAEPALAIATNRTTASTNGHSEPQTILPPDYNEILTYLDSTPNRQTDAELKRTKARLKEYVQACGLDGSQYKNLKEAIDGLRGHALAHVSAQLRRIEELNPYGAR